MLPFLKTNGRWIAIGFLALLSSAFGQTFFVALSGGAIRKEMGLSDGAFGLLYMAATLAGALALVFIGPMVDRWPARRLFLVVVPLLAAGMAGLATASNPVFLFVSLCLLRLFGQGMMVHIAYTLIGRWFTADRGRAISLSALGLNAAQAVLPMLFVAGLALAGWRSLWLAGAVFLLVVILPVILTLSSVERTPFPAATRDGAADGHDKTRGDVLRDPYFYLFLLGMLPPAFISNTIFFHQVHLSDMRGWSPDVFASAFAIYAGVTVASTLVAGRMVDRFSARAVLRFYLLPFGIACLFLGLIDAPWSAMAFMLLYGISDGFSLTLFGSLWPEIYGTRHLGAIRSVIVAIMVFASALGPGLAGLLIDAGLPFSLQIVGMGIYCILICLVLFTTVRRWNAGRERSA